MRNRSRLKKLGKEQQFHKEEETKETNNQEVIISKKLDLVTSGLYKYFHRQLTQEISKENSITIADYILAQKIEANLAAAGVFHAKGQGVIMAGESELATWRVEAIGRISSLGAKYRGSHFYSTSSTGKLASLNNVVGAFEAETDAGGNTSLKIWEWK